MMDIAYITAAVFDILTDSHRTCFSDELKKGILVGGRVNTETTVFPVKKKKCLIHSTLLRMFRQVNGILNTIILSYKR